jgi:cholesterol oxidase
MQQHYDAVVVGSGFGGGTIAMRLARAGRNILVLERGRRWRGKNLLPVAGEPETTAFPNLGENHFFWGRQFWRPNKQRLGLFELRQMINLQGLVGAGVGGGSLIWANVVIEAPEDIFKHGWPGGIDKDFLQKYYRRADPFLRARTVPGVPGIPHPDGRTIKRTELLKQAAEKIGEQWSPVKIAVNFGDEAKAARNGHGAARQLGCNYCGLCSAGCPQNAKNTADITYIAAAEAAGAEVRALHEVTGVEPLGVNGPYRVHFNRFSIDGHIAERGAVIANQVIISAGTFGTTELLLKSKQSGLLPNLSDQLGKRFSTNGNVLSGALNTKSAGADDSLNDGPAIGSMINFDSHVVEDYANPTWAAGIVGSSNMQRALSFALAMAGHQPTEAALRKKAKDLLVYVGVGADQAKGKLKLSPLGGLSLDWPGGINNDPIVKALHASMRRIAESLGRKYVPNVFSIFNRPLTYHPLGGCAMADSAETGVVSRDGEVFGYPNLYVADGSIVPTAIGRNPSYTIAALAELIAEGILSR